MIQFPASNQEFDHDLVNVFKNFSSLVNPGVLAINDWRPAYILDSHYQEGIRRYGQETFQEKLADLMETFLFVNPDLTISPKLRIV